MTFHLYEKAKEIILSVNYTELKKDWSNAEFEQVPQVIFEFFKGESLDVINTQENRVILTKEILEDVFGLPYTSSGAFACLSNTNSEVNFIDNYGIQFFALSDSGEVILICWNEHEAEKAFVIGQV